MSFREMKETRRSLLLIDQRAWASVLGSGLETLASHLEIERRSLLEGRETHGWPT